MNVFKHNMFTNGYNSDNHLLVHVRTCTKPTQVYTHTRTCTYMYIYEPIHHVHVRTCTYILLYMCLQWLYSKTTLTRCKQDLRVYMCTCICTCTCTYIRIHVYMYMQLGILIAKDSAIYTYMYIRHHYNSLHRLCYFRERFFNCCQLQFKLRYVYIRT